MCLRTLPIGGDPTPNDATRVQVVNNDEYFAIPYDEELESGWTNLALVPLDLFENAHDLENENDVVLDTAPLDNSGEETLETVVFSDGEVGGLDYASVCKEDLADSINRAAAEPEEGSDDEKLKEEARSAVPILVHLDSERSLGADALAGTFAGSALESFDDNLEVVEKYLDKAAMTFADCAADVLVSLDNCFHPDSLDDKDDDVEKAVFQPPFQVGNDMMANYALATIESSAEKTIELSSYALASLGTSVKYFDAWMAAPHTQSVTDDSVAKTRDGSIEKLTDIAVNGLESFDDSIELVEKYLARSVHCASKALSHRNDLSDEINAEMRHAEWNLPTSPSDIEQQQQETKPQSGLPLVV